MIPSPSWLPSVEDVEHATTPYVDLRGYPWLQPDPVTRRLSALADRLEIVATNGSGLTLDQSAALHVALVDLVTDLERGRFVVSPTQVRTGARVLPFRRPARNGELVRRCR